MPSFQPLYNLILSLSSKGDWSYQREHTEASLFLVEATDIALADPTKGWLNTYLQIREYFPSLGTGHGAAGDEVFNLYPSLGDAAFTVKIPHSLPQIYPRYLQVRYLPKKGKRFRGSVRNNIFGGYTVDGYVGGFYGKLDKFNVRIQEWR